MDTSWYTKNLESWEQLVSQYNSNVVSYTQQAISQSQALAEQVTKATNSALLSQLDLARQTLQAWDRQMAALSGTVAEFYGNK